MATPRSIHEFTAATIDDSTLVLVDVPDEGAESGYITGQCSTTNLGDLIVNDIEFTQDLQTTSKTIVGAINEVAAASGAAIYSGSAAPTSALGADNSIYIQTSSGAIVKVYGKISGAWLEFPAGGSLPAAETEAF